MSSGHTHNRSGRGNQRRKHGPPRQQPQNSQPQNSQPQNNQPQNSQPQNGQAQNGQAHNSQQQPPRGQNNTTRPTPALSMTVQPARAEAPFQAPDKRSFGDGGEYLIAESITREITEVTLDVEVQPSAAPEQPASALPRPAQQRNTQPPGKRGPYLIPSERQNNSGTSDKASGHVGQHGMQTSRAPRDQRSAAPAEPFPVVEPSAPSGLPRSRRGEYDAPPQFPSYGMPRSDADDTEDEDTDEYVAHERRPLRDVRGDVGTLIDSLHDLFAQDRTVASQGNATRCGICYLHYPLSELEYREVEGYYVCVVCKRALGPAQLKMVRRQQKN